MRKRSVTPWYPVSRRLLKLVDEMSFDPLNILLLAVALVVIWRLRSVLGTRTGTEKPPFQPYDRRDSDSPKTQDTGATVLDFPQTASGDSRGGEQEDRPAVWAGYAEAGSPLAAVLEAIAARDATFTPRNFLDGAKLAYEMTLEAFAKGDKPGLKNLLSRDVFESFSRVIDQREAGGRRVEQNFVGIDKARIQSARLADTMASITVEFVSELITATYDRSGELADGDPKHISRVTDVWTFERDVSSRNPNWKLVATEAPA